MYNSHNHRSLPQISLLYTQGGPAIQQDSIERSENVPALPKETTVPVSNGTLATALYIDLRLLYARTEDIETLYYTSRTNFLKCVRSTYL